MGCSEHKLLFHIDSLRNTDVVGRSHWNGSSSDLTDVSFNRVVGLDRCSRGIVIGEVDKTVVNISKETANRSRFFLAPLGLEIAKSPASLGRLSGLEEMQGVGDDLPSVSLLEQMLGQGHRFCDRCSVDDLRPDTSPESTWPAQPHHWKQSENCCVSTQSHIGSRTCGGSSGGRQFNGHLLNQDRIEVSTQHLYFLSPARSKLHLRSQALQTREIHGTSPSRSGQSNRP